MKLIKLQLKKRSYNIIVGSDTIKFLGRYISRLNIGDTAYVITNAAIKNKYGKILSRTFRQYGFNLIFKLIPATEKSKSLERASSIIKDMAGCDRKAKVFIVAFGGGVIGDLASFIASIYKRGIPYINIPTTLLAQVDSGIGGKTAVDLTEGKNLVGTFYQPRLVFSDVGLLRTLNPRQIKTGLAEVIKYGVIKDPSLFVYLEEKYKDILELKPTALEFIVSRCSQIKAKVVQQDEREEKGIRTILNFGHTIGHAIEAALNYKKYNHGEAVALGMLIASDISNKLGLLGQVVLKRIERLIGKVGLPTKIKNIPLTDIIEAHYRDKKFIGSVNRFVLIKDIGRIKIVENIPLKIIREAIEKRI
jgi:3-dehydroquinate synthase